MSPFSSVKYQLSRSIWTPSATKNLNQNYDEEKNPILQIHELRRRLEEAPQQPGVYMFRDEFGKLLYVGKSVNLKQRLRSYFKKLPSLEELEENPSKVANLEPASSLGRRQCAMVKMGGGVKKLD
jgi:hypothetical protein